MSSGSSRVGGEMDRLSVHQSSPKQATARKKNKQIKVVYISNPMRFKASAAEFKGLVQQFTGQDSDVADLQSRFTDAAFDEPRASSAADRASGSNDDDDSAAASLSRADHPGAAPHDPQQHHHHYHEPYKFAGAAAFESFDEVFNPQVFENLPAFMPSSLYYEAPQPDVGAIRRLDAERSV